MTVLLEGSDAMRFIRKIKTVFTVIQDITEKDGFIVSEKKVNDTIEELRKEHKIVSIMPHNVGLRPVQLIYDIIYEKNNSLGFGHTRFIKTVLLTVNDFQEGENVISENKVNEAIDYLVKNGGKIISILPHNIGLNPILVMYDIIYEAEQVIK